LSNNLESILNGWKYEPGQVNARWINGEDGLPKVQLRLDLGVLQMEIDGRPDGRTPRGYTSLLDCYLSMPKDGVDHPELFLNESACNELQQEVVQYYYRYLAFHALGHLEGVANDTAHNLEIFNLIAEYAVDDELVWHFLQFFPNIRMINAQVQAELCSASGQLEDALQHIEGGIADIEEFWDEFGEFGDKTCEEIDVLNKVLHKLRNKKPKSRKDRLREALQAAIASENYEKAAVLRDTLNTLSGSS